MIKLSDRALDLLLYTLSAAFALVTALTSTLLPHRAWGAVAAGGYLAAAVLVYLVRRRDLLTWAAWGAVALLPTVIQAVQRAGGRIDRAQEEVLVVEHMGESLLRHGTPYLSRTEIAAIPIDERLLGYRPYQPGMSIFGLPRALAGDFWWTDARIWFAVLTLGALAAAFHFVRGNSVRALQACTVLPVTALTLATGGDDIPVMALCLLALALVSARHFGWAGVAVGLAAACKLFALPVVAVLVVLALFTRSWRLLPGALGLPLLALLPPLLVDPDALLENVLRFPLGHGLVTSPAQSPFPGYLISQIEPGGRFLAMGLLGLAAVVIGVLLLRRPPRTARTAAFFCAYGLLTAILLMPTTRFGYLLYPAALVFFALALSKDTASSTAPSAARGDSALYRS